jgi:hypothetical protein
LTLCTVFEIVVEGSVVRTDTETHNVRLNSKAIVLHAVLRTRPKMQVGVPIWLFHVTP